MADLKVLEAVNSSSTGAPGSGCSRLRVVRFLGSPNGRRLRRVLVVLVVIVGSDRGRRMPRLISPLHLRSDSRQSHVPHTLTLLFLLNSHLTKCFSVFCSTSPGKMSFSSSRTAFSDQPRTALWSLTCTPVMRHTKPFLNVLQTRPTLSDGSCIGP